MHIKWWASGFFWEEKTHRFKLGRLFTVVLQILQRLVITKNVSTVPSNMFHRFMVRWKAKNLLIFNCTVINYTI